ncbi:hypothetical protein EWM64_g7875 [Hericium alpestre]|uniref:Uncharacterized protein n=1 Tax=Hericium alpestre TaxID=135208 RepID=A0A4Y9ZQ01_9AGAM|nr:hypothetical protein EWM64_g7875 [Hericium alpestre]
MARHQRSFNTSHRSKAQKRALREAVAQRQRNTSDAKITRSPGATENEDLRRRLHNMQRQFRRAQEARDKARRTSRGSSDDSVPSLGDIMLCTASSSPPSESLTPHASSAVWAALRQAIVKLHRQNDALRKRLSRQVKSSSREIKRAVQKAKVTAVMTYVIKDKGQITDRARALIRSLVDIGIPFSSLLDVIRCVLISAGIEVKGKFSKHSVHRIVLEGGVYARLQIMDEIQHTKSLTISGDGTSFRNINLEAGFMLYKPPGSKTPQLRTLPLIAATSHTSEAQLKGWQGRFNGFCTLWNSSPLIQDGGPVSINSILSKTKGMSSDHANDQKSLAALFEKWKAQVDQEARGQEAVMSMTAVELLTLQIEVMNTCLAQVGGYPGWDALPASEKQSRNIAAHRCGMHKEMNAVKWGTKYMEAFWVSETAKELDAPPPIFLFNRDNAAAVADKTATTAKARAEQVSSRGAIKTASLAGAIFRNKYEKKGQQDAYRYFFSEMLGFIVQFPDTSNTRYGSFCDAACELLVNLVIYLEFLDLMRYNKEKGELNHMEQNIFDALHDPSTLTELAVLSLYSQNISQPYAAFIRDTSRTACRPRIPGEDIQRIYQVSLQMIRQDIRRYPAGHTT